MSPTGVQRTTLTILGGALGVLLIALVPGAAATPPYPTAQDAPPTDEVADVLTDQLDAAGIPGGAFVTVSDDGDVQARGVGTTGDGDPVTASTPFVIGSTTKSFTALGVMQLVDAGEVDLDAPVVRYVPAFRLADGEPVDAVTVRHLLQHTSGLDDLAGGPILGSASEGTALDAVAELEESHLASAPGESWRYANANYVLAGLVVESVSGQGYEQYLQEHVLDPLGMADTYVTADPAVAPGHRYWFGFPAADGPVQREGVVAAGYLASTAEDLGSYLSLYLRDGLAPDGTRLLSVAGIRTLTTPGPEAHLGPWAEGATARYAMGWMVGGPWEESAVFHPGNSPDSSAMIALFPERGLAAATLVPAGHELPVPGNPSITDRISRNTLHAVVGEDVPAPVGRWGFYAWFDAVVLASVALALLLLVRAARAYGRPAGGRLRRWLRPVPALLVAVALLALPAATSAGWAGVWTWAPDLGITLLVLAALAAATAGLRLAGALVHVPPVDSQRRTSDGSLTSSGRTGTSRRGASTAGRSLPRDAGSHQFRSPSNRM
jgi:CubicO group peptidase (beta-lactamase class C family)